VAAAARVLLVAAQQSYWEREASGAAGRTGHAGAKGARLK